MAKAKKPIRRASFGHIKRAFEEFRAANANRGPNARKAAAAAAKLENSLTVLCLQFRGDDCDDSNQVPCPDTAKAKKAKHK